MRITQFRSANARPGLFTPVIPASLRLDQTRSCIVLRHRRTTSAPLSHHLQDSTHIAFGVVTTGFTYRWFKLEGSLFNGREPGENRYNFEANPWTSRSARLWFAPNSNWSMQVSHGFLRNPEALEPGDVRRTTASISYNRSFRTRQLGLEFDLGKKSRESRRRDLQLERIRGGIDREVSRSKLLLHASRTGRQEPTPARRGSSKPGNHRASSVVSDWCLHVRRRSRYLEYRDDFACDRQ